MKFVDYEIWCPKCKHYKEKETIDPCDECLTYPVNENSMKPINFEEGDQHESSYSRKH